MVVTFPIICILSSILGYTSALCPAKSWRFRLNPSQHPQPENEYDVIIMGAGAAGIAAAKVLYEANITNFLIIEANWYVGGRIVTHDFSDYRLNIGASWIHGTCIDSSRCGYYNETNPMLTAANKYNISYVLSNWDHEIILDFNGSEHNITESNNKYYQFENASDCAWNIAENSTRFHDQMSFESALHLCDWSKPLSAIEKTVQWNSATLQGPQLKRSTARSDFIWDTYNKYGPDDLFVTDPRGYQGIIKALANEFLDIDNIEKDNNIILNSPITTIKYNENGVIVTLDDRNYNAQYSAKYGIVTFSLGVLQSDIIDFIPPLPPWKLDPLLAFDWIDYTIIYVQWPYNFWNDYMDSQNVNITEWIILNDDRFGFFGWVYNLDHPNLLNGSLIWRFDLVMDLANIVQYQSINDTITHIIDLKLSHYFDVIPQPDHVFVTPWNKNTYVQGGYSNWPNGFTPIQKETMGWPLMQRLFFAGEAFSDFPYVHSAWISGNNTANQILACMGHGLQSFECPSEYVPSSDECKVEEQSRLYELIWLWIVLFFVLGVTIGIFLGYLFVKKKGHANYSSVDKTDKTDGPMVTVE